MEVVYIYKRIHISTIIFNLLLQLCHPKNKLIPHMNVLYYNHYFV